MEIKQSRKDRAKAKAQRALETSLEFTETTLVLLYIFNGVASFLVLFGFVESSTAFKRIVGAIAFGFSAFALIAFVNKGVKHDTKTKKGKK